MNKALARGFAAEALAATCIHCRSCGRNSNANAIMQTAQRELATVAGHRLI